jgi:hypothetical protein
VAIVFECREPKLLFKTEVGGGIFRVGGFRAGHDEKYRCVQTFLHANRRSLFPILLCERNVIQRNPSVNEFLRNGMRLDADQTIGHRAHRAHHNFTSDSAVSNAARVIEVETGVEE